MQRIHPSERIGVYAQLAGQNVHVALDGVRGLGNAKAPERARRRVVGVHGIAVHLDVRHRVRAARVRRGALEHLCGQTGIGARVAEQFGLHRGQRAVPLGPRLDADHSGVALGMREHGLGTAVEDLDRVSRGLGQQRGVDLPHDVLFAAERAADQRAHDPHLLRRQAHRRCDLLAVGIGDLRAHIHRQLAVVPIIARRHPDAALGFQEHVIVRRRTILTLDDDVRLCQAACHVSLPDHHVFQQVARLPRFVHERGIRLPCARWAVHHLQRLVRHCN